MKVDRHSRANGNPRGRGSPPSRGRPPQPMNRVLDSFWRAAAYCLHPRVIPLSLLPLVVAGGLSALLG